jgi:hypothetical protein
MLTLLDAFLNVITTSMGKSTERITTEHEFAKLEQALNQTADDAANCLKVLKGSLADFDSRHGLHFGNTSKFVLRGDLRKAKDTALELREAANQIAECETPTESEITAARSAMHVVADALNELAKAGRAYDQKSLKSRGLTGAVAGLLGRDKRPKDGSNFDNYNGDPVAVGEKGKVGSAGIVRAPDTVHEVVATTLGDCFGGFSALSDQISTAEKSLSPLFAERTNAEVTSKWTGPEPTNQDTRSS